MNYTDRVEGFQICDPTYIGFPPKGTPPQYDIIKWVLANPPFKAIDMCTREFKIVTEYCYSVGRLVWNRKEPCFEFESVGLRWLEAKPSEAVVDMVLKFAEEKAKELEAEND